MVSQTVLGLTPSNHSVKYSSPEKQSEITFMITQQRGFKKARFCWFNTFYHSVKYSHPEKQSEITFVEYTAERIQEKQDFFF